MLIDVEDLNLADGLIVVDKAQLRIVPGVLISAELDLEPITRIPGIQITNYDGTAGPHFGFNFGGVSTISQKLECLLIKMYREII